MVDKLTKRKIKITVIIITLAVIVRYVPPRIMYIDDKGEQYFNQSVKKALVTYTITRGVNRIVSIVQKSSIGLSLGVHVNISVGEMLDPLNDATERLSQLLTYSIISFGVMGLLYSIMITFTPLLISYLILFSIIFVWSNNKTSEIVGKMIINLSIFLVIARFVLPVSGIINSNLYENYFKPKMTENKKILIPFSKENNDIRLPQSSGYFSFLGKGKEYYGKVRKITSNLWDNKGKIITAIVNLLILYSGILFIQIFLIPITMFWIGLKIINAFWDKDRFISLKDN